MSDDYIKLRDKYKKSDLSGYRRGNTDTSSMKSSTLPDELKKNLAKLKKDLTWSPLPDLRKVPKKELNRDDAIGMAMDLMQTTPVGALAGVIKDKGGNWLGDSVKKALAKLQHTEFTPNHKTQMLNSWIDGPLQKYVKNRMATPDDEIRKLADQGILHVNPEQLNFRPEMYGKGYMMQPGQRNMAVSDMAKSWEGASDNSITPSSAAYIRSYVKGTYGDEFDKMYPWFDKLAKEKPGTSIYDLNEPPYFVNNLGFDHLIDELSNAMDEGSGFPMNLRLTPEGLQGLSVEEAIRKVDGINKFRAEKAAKANARFAAAEGIPVYKEYPEGYRWLEYKIDQADELTEAVRYEKMKLEKGEEAAKRYLENNKKEKLAEWLKREGDTMGHCVGGYCDDVISGRSRILSLRDPEGKSVATVELSPHIDYSNPGNQRWMINQIKGAGNRKPPEHAMPYLQDFVRGEEWGDVLDLHNAGLVPGGKHGYLTPRELLETEPYKNALYDFDIDKLSEDGMMKIIRAIDEGTY